jgi:hypothetical protein
MVPRESLPRCWPPRRAEAQSKGSASPGVECVCLPVGIERSSGVGRQGADCPLPGQAAGAGTYRRRLQFDVPIHVGSDSIPAP